MRVCAAGVRISNMIAHFYYLVNTDGRRVKILLYFLVGCVVEVGILDSGFGLEGVNSGHTVMVVATNYADRYIFVVCAHQSTP